MTLSTDELGFFAQHGYLVRRNAIPRDKLELAELAIRELYRMQGDKIEYYRADPARSGTMAQLLGAMEARDKEALYQVQKFFPQNQDIRALYGPWILDVVWELLGKNFSFTQLLVEGPGLFVSRPETERLLYKWHSEAHYYPKRRRFVNVWFPIFTARDTSNGSMSVLPRSHRREWQFSEYQGYDADTLGKKHHFVQYEIPEVELQEYLREEQVFGLGRGDALLFDRNLVHRSNMNHSSEYAYAMVARVWTPVHDLTLAGNMAVTPFGGDPGGRPGLVGSGYDAN